MQRILKEIEAQDGPFRGLDPVKVRTGIERHHIETALAVQFHGSFGKAAQALGMLSSTVGGRVRNLEFQLGCPLFERQKRRLVPTPAGRVFLRHSADILYSFHTLVQAMRRMADGKAGQISIGYHGAAAQGDLHRLLFEPDPLYPDVQHLPVELTHEGLFEALVGRRIDLAIVRSGLEGFRGRSAPLWRERIVLCLPQAHPLASQEGLAWSDLCSERFLVSAHDPIHGIRRLINARLSPLGIVPEIATHDVSIAALLHMVGAGRGISLCLESVLGDQYAGTVFRELAGPDGPDYVTSFACWYEDDSHPALDRLLGRLLASTPNQGKG